jgi:hypothetical protein
MCGTDDRPCRLPSDLVPQAAPSFDQGPAWNGPEEDDPGHRRGNVAVEALERPFGDLVRRGAS